MSLTDKINKFITDSLKMELVTLLVYLLSFVVVCACIGFFVWKPTNDFINRQKKKLEKERTDLVVNNREARYFLGLLRKERYELFHSKRAIINAAVDEAGKLRQEAKLASQKVLVDAQARANERVKAIENKARDQIKKYIVDSAVELTEKLIDANISEANNKSVIDAYIKELEHKRIMSDSERTIYE